MTEIYLDNNATTRPLASVVDAVRKTLELEFGNPSSLHGPGQRARALVEEARARMAALIRCRETEIVFTSGATESMNTAIRGALEVAPAGRKRLVTTAVEHEATIEIGHKLKAQGVDVVFLPVDSDGRLDLERLKDEVKTPTALLSLMYVNNETGVQFDVPAAASIAKAAGAQVHLDAVQVVGKIPIDVDALGVDLLSLSGHKFHGPKGTGILYIRRNARIRPSQWGAAHEGGRRAGTENVSGLVGMGVAAAHMAEGIPARTERLSTLTRYLEKRVLAIPDSRLNGGQNLRAPGTVNVSFRGIEGAAVVISSAREGVCLSAGSACSAAQFGGSHVLEAMGVPFDYLYGAVRFSCSEQTTEAELDRAVVVVSRAVEYLRAMSPEART